MKEKKLEDSTQKIEKLQLNRGIREIKREIKTRLINGENVEEIKKALIGEVSEEKIENICDEYQDLALLAKGMPTSHTNSDEYSLSQQQFWEMIKKGIESKRIKLSTIPLGKSKSGKDIFLKDVWPDDARKVRYR